MKLNTRRTLLIGLAFFSICAFWQMYDHIIPLILRDTFGVGDSVSGWIMAADNILALFLLPLFGRLSDRTNTPLGKRMPYIVGGTACSALLIGVLARADAPGRFPLFITALGLLLVSMGTYRSPAVALMPDVTPKPLRSKANAIINLMGALGGIYALGAISLLVRAGADGRNDYGLVFFSVAALMVVSIVALAVVVRENKLRRENADTEPEPEQGKGEKLPPEMMRSLVFILVSVALWFMGYNAVTTAYSRYYTAMWDNSVAGAANCMMIAMGGAVLSYIPVGIISSKIGRRRMILIGVATLAVCFALAGLVKTFNLAVYALFVIIGFAWAAINVNSYPMVVEISHSGDVGKYTGYYYTFSMAAQVLTPIVSGWLLEHVGYQTLFPYAAGMVAASFVTMLFVKHGDNRPGAAKNLLEHYDVEE
ncbi:MAG: MFS transporter [Clostridia bacterium]|nr:MFS transporter [Clostridia bacterium]MBO4883677.1 MFS transporter [Clostridia bacterium]